MQTFLIFPIPLALREYLVVMNILPHRDLWEFSIIWVLKGVWQSRFATTDIITFWNPKLMLWGSCFMIDLPILCEVHGLSSRIVGMHTKISRMAFAARHLFSGWMGLLFIQCSGKTAGESLVLIISDEFLGKVLWNSCNSLRKKIFSYLFNTLSPSNF